MRLGHCCTFLDAPIKLRHTTARYAGSLAPRERQRFLVELSLHNAAALADAVRWCGAHDVGAFRIHNELVPLLTHPQLSWKLDPAIVRALRAVPEGVRLSFHPDQFVVPGSERSEVVASSLRELESLATIAALVGAEQLTIHGGGARPTKQAALARLEAGLRELSPRARTKVALENDDTVYTVEDLLPVCARLKLPLIYDVHHHRCNPDALSIEQATDHAAETWRGREPWMHLSSPAARRGDRRPHADYIAPRDVPAYWRDRSLTVDIEAKAKERAVLRLKSQLARAA